jgi:hypothetical protein
MLYAMASAMATAAVTEWHVQLAVHFEQLQ